MFPGKVGNDLPTVGTTGQLLVRRLNPDHRDAVLARSGDKQANVGHDSGVIVSLFDNSILHVNYEKCVFSLFLRVVMCRY